MLGTAINAISIVVMGLIGYMVGRKLSRELREYVMKVMGLVVFLIGIEMAVKTSNFPLITLSLLSGALVGRAVGIERRLETLGAGVEKRFQNSKFSEGFVTGTLLFCVGSMAVIGPIQEALTGDMSVLITKSVLDGIASAVLSSALGIGVVFSAISVFLYQSFFYLGAVAVKNYATAQLVNEITSLGGVLIAAIGLNLMKMADLRPGDMLPSFIFVPIYLIVLSFLTGVI